jgi:hypothetical protein
MRSTVWWMGFVLASAESPNLPEPVDVVLVVDTFHHIDHRIATTALECSRVSAVAYRWALQHGGVRANWSTSCKISQDITAAGLGLMLMEKRKADSSRSN